jgi:hypothetical protein
MSNVYPGISAFFANRTKPNDNHNWLVNNNRPFLSLITTAPDGSKSYDDLFLNKHDSIKVKATAKQVVITFPADLNQPLFRILKKQS